MIKCTALQPSSNSMNSHRLLFVRFYGPRFFLIKHLCISSDTQHEVNPLVFYRVIIKSMSTLASQILIPPLFRACSKYSNLFLVLVNFISRARALSVIGDQLLSQTLVKMRVETQAMCLAQLVLSCMNTLLDLSSSVSTSVL